MKRKLFGMFVTGMLAVSVLAGCGSGGDTPAAADNVTQDGVSADEAAADTADTAAGETASGDAADNFDTTASIAVYSREDGSGTRGAFVELFGIEEADESGEKFDNTTEEAVITNSTDVMLTSVAGDTYGIGYVSLGSLNDTVKAVKIDGADATVENIKNGTYTIARPFHIATTGAVSEAAQDFINYILSAEGQAVITANGYIGSDNAAAFAANGAAGKVVVGGSSSVAPVMEKLIEGYKAVNAEAEIELQSSDSSTGMTGAADGTLDIGMASRELKDSETESGLTGTQIAMDGIAVIVNHENPADSLTSETVKNIFTGAALTWDAAN